LQIDGINLPLIVRMEDHSEKLEGRGNSNTETILGSTRRPDRRPRYPRHNIEPEPLLELLLPSCSYRYVVTGVPRASRVTNRDPKTAAHLQSIEYTAAVETRRIFISTIHISHHHHIHHHHIIITTRSSSHQQSLQPWRRHLLNPMEHRSRPSLGRRLAGEIHIDMCVSQKTVRR
jgi:hypothetical protein